MANLKILTFLTLSAVLKIATASYSGPFLLWGTENLNKIKAPGLQAIDDKTLRDVYASATSVVVFVRNSTTALTKENFPRLSEIVASTESLYLPQDQLTSDPVEYNVNAEVFVLTGPVEQQDVEIAAFYRDAQVNFAQNNILGILATRHEHAIFKRQAEPFYSSTTESPSSMTTPANDEPVENLIYLVDNKGMLHTTDVPVLKIPRENKEPEVFQLNKHSIVTADDRNDVFKLIINFMAPDKIPVRLIFNFTGRSWRLTQAEVDFKGTFKVLEVVGQAPSGPTNNSYACGASLEFKSKDRNPWSLTFRNIQVEPRLQFKSKFSSAYDCVGVTTPAILSGTFVVAILGIVLTIGITAILDIKSPNKFENRSSKQLTFTVQE